MLFFEINGLNMDKCCTFVIRKTIKLKFILMSNLFCSSIGKKLVMSLTGVFMILFLIFHASMNLVAIISASGYDAVCEFLGANWYALVGTLILAAGFLIHILLSFLITIKNRKARGPQRYASVARPKEVSWAGKNMLVLGFIILGFIGLHLWQFWAKMQLVEIMGGHEVIIDGQIFSPTGGSALIAYYFSNPCYAILYLLWMGALWFHLTHGFWSAFQTIGWNNKVWIPRLEKISFWVATLICLAFAAVVVVFYLRSVMCTACI